MQETVLRAMLETSPMGIFLWDLQGNCLYANPKCGEILGLGWIQALDGLSAELHDRQLPFSQIIRKGDSWIKIILTPFMEGGCLGTLEDVTIEKKAADEKNQLLNALLENFPIVLFRVNREGTITLSAGNGLRVLGISDHALEGYQAVSITPWVREFLDQPPKGIVTFFSSENTPDGEEAHFQNSILSDLEGGIIGMSLDITQIKVTEMENAEKTGLLNTILEHLPIIVYKIDQAGYCTLSVGAGLKALGLREGESVGSPNHPFRRAMNGELETYTEKMEDRGGGGYYFQNTFFPDPDGRGGIMGVALDITEIKNAEVAKQQFLSNMSHEIRTPLNAIIGMTHLLLAEQVPPEMQENLKILKFSGENLLVLVNDILDYSKILSGKVSFESIDFSLRDFVQSIRQSHLFKATEKGITLKMKLDSDLPDRLNGDPMRLAQVLNNLISNAIKFTNAGSVTVDLTLGEMGPQHVTIDFAIRDTGIGIDPSLKEFIFESFTQASADTTRRFGGTGLGLAITRSLLQLQGSDIFLESEIGKGSLFYFRLRLGKSQKETFSVSNQLFGETTGEKKDLAGYKVLLVEDNEMNRIVAKKFMTRWALEVAYAQNGVEAVGMMEEEHYHLVLMDLQMPRMDGYEATRRIRALPGCERLPIIALTASVEPEVMEKIKLAGMTDYMSKPFNPNELYAKIAQHLSL